MTNRKFDAKSIVTLGLLMALEIILTRFVSIQTPIVRIGFGFLPTVIMAILYGPWLAGTASAFSDLLGFFLFPSGMFFPGFTLSAFLSGMIYGLVLYRKEKTLGRIILAIALVTLFVNLGLNTLWLTILTEQAIYAIFPARVLQNAILAPVNVFIVYAVLNNKILRTASGI